MTFHLIHLILLCFHDKILTGCVFVKVFKVVCVMSVLYMHHKKLKMMC